MTSTINSIAEHWWTWQVAMLWQTAILVGIIWAVDRGIRKWAHPQIRYALWLLVLVKLVLPPTLTSPASITDKIPAIAQKAVLPFNSPPAKGDSPEGRRGLAVQPPEVSTEIPTKPTTEAWNGSDTMENHERLATSENSIATATSPVAERQPAETVSLTLKAWGLFAWLAGMVVLTAWLMCRLSGLRKQHLQLAQANLPEWFDELLAATAARLGVKRTPRVILTDKVACPAVFGLFHPVLLIPAGKLRHMTQPDTEHILLHELAHIKRRDLWIHAVYMTLQIVYWFNPLLWLTRRPLQNLRELCCDATVARLLKDNTYRYRETLLETARQLLAEPVDPGLGLLGLFENNNWLVTRLQWLEKNTWKHRKLTMTAVAVLVTLMTACVLPMANRPEFKVTGTVADSETGEPIANVEVFDDGYNDGKCRTTTDENGHFVLKTANEEHNISARAKGYQPQTKTLTTFPLANNKNFNFKLTKVFDLNKKNNLAVLPDGDIIRLIALFRPQDDPVVFWSPDGNVIEGPKLASYHLGDVKDDELAYVLQRPGIHIDGGHENPAPDGNFYSVHGWKAFQLESGEPLVVKRASGYGNWTDMGTIKEGQDLGNYHLEEIGEVESGPLKQVRSKMFWKFNSEFGIRLVAVDKKGNAYPMEASDEFLGDFREGQRMLYYQAVIGLNKSELSHFKLQRRPLFWAMFDEFAVEPKQSGSNSGLKTNNYITTLPNGVTVELMGVCEHPSFDKRWWMPNGDLLNESPYDNEPYGRAFPKWGENGYKFAVKLSSMAYKDVEFMVIPSEFIQTQRDNVTKKNGKENTKYVEDWIDEKVVGIGASFVEKSESCDIEVGVCFGKWRNEYRYEDDKPNDAVEWVKFNNVSLRPNFDQYAGLSEKERIIRNAESQARLLNHEYIGTEHILLGLIADKDRTVSQILNDSGITGRQVYDEILRLVKKNNRVVFKENLPMTDRAKLAFKNATQLAKESKSDTVNSIHILLGLIQVEDGVAAQVLKNLGLNLKKAQEAVALHPGEKVDEQDLFQEGKSMNEMLDYIGSPPEKWDIHAGCIRQIAGQFAGKEDYELISKLVNIKSIDDYLLLLCPESRTQVQTTPQGQYWLDHISQRIEKNTFPYETGRDSKAVWMIKEYDLDLSDSVEFVIQPTHVLIPFTYHKEKKMVIGNSICIHKSNGTETVVADVPLQEGIDQLKAIENMTVLSKAFRHYAIDHDNILPFSIKELKSDIEDETVYQQLLQDVTYLGSGKTLNDFKDTVIARHNTIRDKEGDPMELLVSGYIRFGSVTKHQPSRKPYSATLPNGVTVELLGVCGHPGKGKQWWSPDGSAFEPEFYVQPREEYNGQNRRTFVVKLNTEEFNLKFNIKGVDSYSGMDVYGARDKTLSNYYSAVALMKNDNDFTDVRIGTATGSWQTIAEYDGGRNFSVNDILFSEPVAIDDGTQISASGEFDFSGSRRFVAFDKEGALYEGSWSGRSSGDRTIAQGTFYTIKPDQIVKYQIQYRPYEWVTFKNVALRPGIQSSVTSEQLSEKKAEGSSEQAVDNQPIPNDTIIERTLHGPKQFGGFDADWFDFRTDTVFDFPPTVKFWDVPQWMADRGIDVVCVPSENGPTLTGNGKVQNSGGTICKFMPTESDMNATPADLDAQWQKDDAHETIAHAGWDGLPHRYFFKSRSGDNGILEITAIDDIARSLTFRYKLFEQAEAASGSDTMQPSASSSQPSGEKIDITPADFKLCYDDKRQTYHLVVSIENQGEVTIPKHRIRYYRGNIGVFDEGLDETGNQPTGWHEAGPIKPGEIWNERTRDFGLPDGDYTFTVILDYDNAIDETNEGNNRAALDITIKNGRIVER